MTGDAISIARSGKSSWGRKWQATIFLPEKFQGQRSLVGYRPKNHKESDTTRQLSMHTQTLFLWLQQEFIRSNRLAPIVNERVWSALLGFNHKKWQNKLCFQGKPFSITEIQVYATTTDAEEAEVDPFCEDLEDLLELTHNTMSFSL